MAQGNCTSTNQFHNKSATSHKIISTFQQEHSVWFFSFSSLFPFWSFCFLFVNERLEDVLSTFWKISHFYLQVSSTSLFLDSSSQLNPNIHKRTIFDSAGHLVVSRPQDNKILEWWIFMFCISWFPKIDLLVNERTLKIANFLKRWKIFLQVSDLLAFWVYLWDLTWKPPFISLLKTSLFESWRKFYHLLKYRCDSLRFEIYFCKKQ